MSDLTAATEDYLKYIWSATEWSGDPVTTSKLARDMGLSASTVSESISKLAREGLVEHKKYHSIRLSPEGTKHALAMVRAHRLIETYLHQVLGYSWDEVHDEAEALEHAVSARFIDAIDELLGHPQFDPHGDPIPNRDGHVPIQPGIPLSDVGDGNWRVVRVDDSDPAALRAASDLNLHPGTVLQVKSHRVTLNGKHIDVSPFGRIIWVSITPTLHP